MSLTMLLSLSSSTVSTTCRYTSVVTRRRFASKAPMTAAERESARQYAHDKMKYYHENRPPLEVIHQGNKKRSQQRDSQHKVQVIMAGTCLVALFAAPLLGRRIAQDADFRESFIPSWYDFTVKKPERGLTREELHQQVLDLQRDLHERTIRGEFTAENLDKMRRHFAGVDPENDPNGWGKLHPGIDDDEDIEE